MLVSPSEIPKKNRRHYEGSAISWSHRPKSTSEAQPRKGPAVSTVANSMPTPVLWQNWPPDFAVAKVPRQTGYNMYSTTSSTCSTIHFQNIKILNQFKSLTLRTKFLQKFTRLPNLFHLKYPTNFHEEEVMARSSPSSPWQSWKLDISARRGWRLLKKTTNRNITEYHCVTWWCRYYSFSKHLLYVKFWAESDPRLVKSPCELHKCTGVFIKVFDWMNPIKPLRKDHGCWRSR